MQRRPGRLVLLGHPVTQSLSPVFQNAALAALHVPLRYEPLDVPPLRFDRTFADLATQHAAGNVTIPHKERAFRHCRQVTEVAERTGVINTFRTTPEGHLEGTNTDVAGFAALAASELGGAAPRRMAVLGAGGGAAAVLAAAEGWRTTRAILYNRSEARARALARRFPLVEEIAASAREALQGADLVVNATSLGMHDDALPVSTEHLPRDAVVLDLVYRPGGTRWVREARAAGHPAADGTTMLLEQGALAFEFWLGMEAPRDVMRAALVERQGAANQ